MIAPFLSLRTFSVGDRAVCRGTFYTMVMAYYSFKSHIPKTAQRIFTKSYDKRAVIEKLSFWFLNSFGGGREVENGHFRCGPSFTKCNVAAIFTKRKRKSSNFGRIILYQQLKAARKSVKGRPRSFGTFGAFYATMHACLHTGGSRQ